jgi:hypothetical protein
VLTALGFDKARLIALHLSRLYRSK